MKNNDELDIYGQIKTLPNITQEELVSLYEKDGVKLYEGDITTLKNNFKRLALMNTEPQEKLNYRVFPSKESIKKVVCGNLWLARWLAYKHYIKSDKKEEMDDIFQVASETLIKAARNYIPNNQAKFTTYATKSIENNLSSFLYRPKKKRKNVSQFFNEKMIKLDELATILELLIDEEDMTPTKLLCQINQYRKKYNAQQYLTGNPSNYQPKVYREKDKENPFQKISEITYDIKKQLQYFLCKEDNDLINLEINQLGNNQAFIKYLQQKINNLKLYLKVEKQLYEEGNGILPSDEEFLKRLNEELKKENQIKQQERKKAEKKYQPAIETLNALEKGLEIIPDKKCWKWVTLINYHLWEPELINSALKTMIELENGCSLADAKAKMGDVDVEKQMMIVLAYSNRGSDFFEYVEKDFPITYWKEIIVKSAEWNPEYALWEEYNAEIEYHIERYQQLIEHEELGEMAKTEIKELEIRKEQLEKDIKNLITLENQPDVGYFKKQAKAFINQKRRQVRQEAIQEHVSSLGGMEKINDYNKVYSDKFLINCLSEEEIALENDALMLDAEKSLSQLENIDLTKENDTIISQIFQKIDTYYQQSLIDNQLEKHYNYLLQMFGQNWSNKDRKYVKIREKQINYNKLQIQLKEKIAQKLYQKWCVEEEELTLENYVKIVKGVKKEYINEQLAALNATKIENNRNNCRIKEICQTGLGFHKMFTQKTLELLRAESNDIYNYDYRLLANDEWQKKQKRINFDDPTGEEVIQNLFFEKYATILDELSDQEKEIMLKSYDENGYRMQKQKEIAFDLEIKTSQVSYQKQKVLKKLRNNSSLRKYYDE